jgi:LEA14-like dessication related protein
VGAGKAVARISIVLAALLLGACATLRQDFKEPGVALVSITPQIRNLFAPEFDIVLHVTNPNRDALEIVGLSYTIHLQGNKVIDGVASELPIIPAYGEADVRLRAVVDLMSGLNLLGDLLGQPDGKVAFELNADIDLGTFYPMVKVNRSGVIALQ